MVITNLFAEYIHQSKEALVFFDSNESISLINSSAVQLLKMTEAEVKGKNISNIFDDADFIANYATSLESSDPFEINLKKSNEVFPLLVVAKKLSSGGCLILKDKLKSNQDMDKKQLEEAMNLLSVLARGISHDFSNKLMEIGGSINLLVLDSQNLTQTQRKFLFDAQKSLFQATGLVKQFQYLTLEEKSKNIRIDLYSVVSNVFSFLDRASTKVVDKIIDFEPNLYFVFADPVKLNQVILNLTNTLIKAMGSLGATSGKYLKISAKLADKTSVLKDEIEARDLIHIIVEDNGSNIGNQLKDKVFLPYTVSNDVNQGIMKGLGLAIAYDFVTRQFNGSIEVHGLVENKTQIDIFLPGTLQEEEIDFEKQISAPLPQGTETILIADDEQVVRNVLSVTLKQLGYKVVLVSNGEEAVNVYRDQQQGIDLILLDVTMPKLSGSEVMARIFEFDSQIKIIISSGHTEEEIQLGILARANGHLNKPYDRKELALKVREVLDK